MKTGLLATRGAGGWLAVMLMLKQNDETYRASKNFNLFFSSHLYNFGFYKRIEWRSSARQSISQLAFGVCVFSAQQNKKYGHGS